MKPGTRRLLIGVATAIVLGAAGYLGYRALDSKIADYDIVLTPSQISADGVSSSLLEIRLLSRFGHRLDASALPSAPVIRIAEGESLVRVMSLGDSLTYRLVANHETGTVRVQARIPGAPAPIEAVLELMPSLADRNHNGYPDQIDLSSESDRRSFRRWFTAIAIGQMTHLDDRWNDRDCAGLLRYCYREALKRHDNAWLAARKWLVDVSIPDVRKYNYPAVPLVGTRVFNAGSRPGDAVAREASLGGNGGQRNGGGSHGVKMIENFVEFAEAARLKDNSLRFLSRSPDDALPGDVIFYLNDTDSEWPYHSMIYLGNGRTIYHTGPDDDKPGIVKRMDLADLAQHPNPRWHPIASNPYFLGFYRWRILG
jgi:uncharacterized protein YfaT (DUF1175 family)